MSTFKTKVISVVKAIPPGEVLTYGEVGNRAGYPGAARAVGGIMSKNQDKSVPCHRVIRKDGLLGKYNGLNGSSKLSLLKKEGAL